MSLAPWPRGYFAIGLPRLAWILNLILAAQAIGTWAKNQMNGAQACIRKNGSEISDLRGRQFEQSDFEDFDRIYTMDESNHKNVLKLTDNPQHKSKVKMLLNETHPGSNMSVPDPYFGR